MNNLYNNQDNRSVLEFYNDVSFFLIAKLKQDIPFARIDNYIDCRNLTCITITCGELTISITLELGYIEFCGIEYDFNLFDIVKLIKAIQHYLLKYSTADITRYVYIEDPWGW